MSVKLNPIPAPANITTQAKVYGYATGVFSSRRLERATYDSLAFRYIAANTHPDHDTLATFRRRFLDELAQLFVQVLELAKEMKLLKLGNVCLDGTKIHANASRRGALCAREGGVRRADGAPPKRRTPARSREASRPRRQSPDRRTATRSI